MSATLYIDQMFLALERDEEGAVLASSAVPLPDTQWLPTTITKQFDTFDFELPSIQGMVRGKVTVDKFAGTMNADMTMSDPGVDLDSWTPGFKMAKPGSRAHRDIAKRSAAVPKGEGAAVHPQLMGIIERSWKK